MNKGGREGRKEGRKGTLTTSSKSEGQAEEASGTRPRTSSSSFLLAWCDENHHLLQRVEVYGGVGTTKQAVRAATKPDTHESPQHTSLTQAMKERGDDPSSCSLKMWSSVFVASQLLICATRNATNGDVRGSGGYAHASRACRNFLENSTQRLTDICSYHAAPKKKALNQELNYSSSIDSIK